MDDDSNTHLAKYDDVILIEQEEGEAVAASKCSITGETITEQQRMQNNIAEYKNPIVRTDPRTKFDPDLSAARKRGKGGKKTSRTQSRKALIEALSKRIEK